jgi:hypothetical protein
VTLKDGKQLTHPGVVSHAGTQEERSEVLAYGGDGLPSFAMPPST